MRSLVLLFLISTFALTFTAETDISGCTVDINSLASSVGGTFNGYYTEWDCTNVLTSYNNYIRNHVTATCRWYWDNHFQMIFSPKNPGDDPWVIHSGMIRPKDTGRSDWMLDDAASYVIGWKYWMIKEIEDLQNQDRISPSCQSSTIILGGDLNGKVYEMASSAGIIRVTWNSPKPILMWGCYGYANSISLPSCSQGGTFIPSGDNSPYLTTSETWPGVFILIPSTETGNYSYNAPYGGFHSLSSIISPSPGTLRVLKELDPQTVEEGGTVEVTVRFDLPVSSNIVLTDSYPSDFTLTGSVDIYLLNAETNTLVSHTTQSVSPSCSGGTCTFSLNLDNLTSEPLFYMVKYRLTAPSVSTASSYTFPPATVSFRVST